MDAFTGDGPLEPADLAMLQRVLDQQCALRGFSKQSDDAMDLAILVMDLFQKGIRSEQSLAEIVNSRFALSRGILGRAL